ncbi:MAG: hypothetical protein JWN86_3378 [Planctomycetota bacterium]|nr:hypothetical protein [Planctomycetota bacterium]
MSSINFADLRHRHPRLTNAFDVLEAWRAANRWTRHIEPCRILGSDPDVDVFELSVALNTMVNEGLLKRSFGVRAPDRTLAMEGFFDAPGEIPSKLHSGSDGEFVRGEGELVQVYREVLAK